MARSSYGTGTIFKRGNIWYVSYWVDGKQVQKSSGSANIHFAIGTSCTDDGVCATCGT